MRLAFVSLELGGGLESETATMVGTSVGASIRRSVGGPNNAFVDWQLGLGSHGTRLQLATRGFQSRKRGREVRSLLQEIRLGMALLVELGLLNTGVLAGESLHRGHGRAHGSRALTA